MTVQSTTSRADYKGNNVTTLFTVPFYFLDNTHVKAVRTDNSTVPPTAATLVLNSDYVLTGAGVQIGGQIQTTVAPTASQVVTLLRNVPFTQLIHYVPNDPFPAATHEQALDQLTMEVQELNEVTTHALQFPSYEPVPATLPSASIRAQNLLGFDAFGSVTLLPMPASVGAGDLRADVFSSGVDFTNGTSTSVTLSRAPGTVANCEVFFDGVFQGPDQILSLVGSQLTFTSPIPVGVQKVYVRSGTTLSLMIPAAASITDAMVAAGTKLSNRINGSVLLSDYAADPTGVIDATAALRAAVATGHNVDLGEGIFYVKDAISVGNQIIHGRGRFKTTILVDSAFNMAALGVFISTATGAEYQDFAVKFTQPDTSTFASLTSYPPAIYGVGIPGQRVRRLYIMAAMTGIDWRDNVGQSSIEDLLESNFVNGIWLDGSVDTVRVTDHHWWPAGLTTNQALIMGTRATGMNVGRCDDLKVSKGLYYSYNPFTFFSGTRANAGTCFGTIENCDLDGYGGIVLLAGNITVNGGVQTAGTLVIPKLTQSGGTILYSGVQFQVGGNFPATPVGALLNVNGTGAVCTIDGCTFYKPNDACINYNGNGQVNVVGGNLIHQVNANFVVPAFAASGTGTTKITGMQCSPLGTGAQIFFSAPTDAAHVISGNQFYGHSISAPLGIGYYAGNFNGTINTDFTSNVLTGGLRMLRFTVTADGSGVATIVHNLGQAQYKVLLANAFFKGASGEAKPAAIASIDGTNYLVTGATAGARVRATFLYTETQDVW